MSTHAAGARSRRRVLADLTMMLGAAPAVAACGITAGGTAGTLQGDAAPSAQIKRGATIVWAVDDGPTRTPLREDQTKLFKTKFPDVNVEFLVGATSPTKLQSLFAAGTPPDLLRQETAGMAFFASRNQLAPLDPLMKRDKYDLADFYPVAWDLWRWKGRYYGVPFIGIRVYFYNRALLTQTGARKPPASWRDANWSWDAFLDLTRRVTLRQGASATRWGTEVSTGRRDWQPWVWNNGGDLFNADATKVLVADPPAVEAIQYLADLIHKHRVAPTADELREQGTTEALFQASNMLMYHRPINQVAANRRGASFDWSVTAAPRGKAKQAWSSGGGVGWFISADSKVKDETWELAKVLASKEGVRMEAVRGEAPPSRRSVANEPEFISPAEPPGADMKVVAEALEAMHLEAPLIQGVEADAVLTEELAPVWRGQKTAREALQQAATRLTPLLNPPG